MVLGLLRGFQWYDTSHPTYFLCVFIQNLTNLFTIDLYVYEIYLVHNMPITCLFALTKLALSVPLSEEDERPPPIQ
jgi:hypothetical protein